MSRTVALAAWWIASSTAMAACPPDYQAATELRITLERADSVWVGMADGAIGMAEVVRNAVTCAPEVLTPADAARVHRTMGLAAAVGGDDERAERLFAAAKSIEPDVPAPARSVGGASAVEAYRRAEALPALQPVTGEWRIDGIAQDSPQLDRPSVTQRVDGERIQGTVWLDTGDPVPLNVACDVVSSRRLFADHLTAAQQALSSFDRDGLADEVRTAEGTLTCLPDALSSIEAAHLLRLHGVVQWVAGPEQRPLADPWFAAAREIQPRYQFPSNILLPTHPLSVAVTDTLGEPAEQTELPAARGMLLVNGEPTHQAPLNRPWVLQHVENGQATLGALIRPGDPIPAWPAPLIRPIPPVEPRERGTKGIKASTLAVNLGAAALIGVGGGLWGGANYSINRYCPPPNRGCPGDLGTRATTQRTVGITMLVTGAAVGGLGTGLTVSDLQ